MTALTLEDMTTGEALEAADRPSEPETRIASSSGFTQWHVHLLGKAVEGPFAHVDDDGSPMLELYELNEIRDSLKRRNLSPAWVGLVPYTINRAQLVEDPDLGPRLYRLIVRGAGGQALTQGDVDLRPPAAQRQDQPRSLLRGRRQRAEPKPAEPPRVTESPPMMERLLGRIEAMDAAHRSELEAERRTRTDAIEATHRHYQRQIESMRVEHRAAIEAIEARAQQEAISLRAEVADLRRQLDAKRDEVQALRLDLVRAEVAAKTAPAPSTELMDIVQAAQKRQNEIEQLREVLGGQQKAETEQPISIKATVTDTLDSLQELTTRITTWGQLLGG